MNKVGWFALGVGGTILTTVMTRMMRDQADLEFRLACLRGEMNVYRAMRDKR